MRPVCSASLFIEPEYLLLGLLREDKALVNRFFHSHAAVEAIRGQIEAHTERKQKVPTSVDLPLSHECKRVLVYGAEESDRLGHKYICTDHLLLGLLRVEECFAAQLLRERGLTLDSVRGQAQESEPPAPQSGPAPFARLDQWLAEYEARGGISTVKQKGIAIYACDQPEEIEQIVKRIDFTAKKMENAIGNHEFEKARLYSDEERKERENLRVLREQLNLEEPPPRVPLLCIEVIGDERFSEVQKRCDDHVARGATQVWLLDPASKRAYTVTKADGLREFKGGTLQIADPPLEMDLGSIFG